LIYRYGKIVTADQIAFPILNNKEEVIENYLYQFYRNNLPPQTLYMLESSPEIEFLVEELGFNLKLPLRSRKKEIIALARKNAQQI
jgi:excinuclease ABC subunit C